MKISDIVKICNGKLLSGSDDILITSFSKDTRTINPGDVYVGIKGEKFDGNDYVYDAFEKGASCALIDKKDFNIENNEYSIILVNNTVDALCDLARHKRDNFNGKVVGITGSVGKTTTKDLVAKILETKYKVLKTTGSYNNNIGLPLSILNGEDADIWVIEMGMNNLGEISFLSKIAKPNISIITNIGTSHIGRLGSRENILKAKLEILDGMVEKKLVVNNDNDMLHEYANNNKNVITVGIKNNSDINIKYIDDKSVLIDNNQISIFNNAEPLVIDSALAYTVAKEFDVDMSRIKEVLRDFKQEGNRLNEEKINNDITIINDAFNASYDSVKLAIDYLSKFPKRKIIVLGDMLELGEYSETLHKDVGSLVSKSNIDVLVTVGDLSKTIISSASNNGYKGITKHFSNNEDCLDYLKELIASGDVILFKASKKMDFINLCNKLKEI